MPLLNDTAAAGSTLGTAQAESITLAQDVISGLQGLPHIQRRLCGEVQLGGPPTADELQRLARLLNRASGFGSREALDPKFWLSVCEAILTVGDGSVGVAMLRLVTIAVRLPPCARELTPDVQIDVNSDSTLWQDALEDLGLSVCCVFAQTIRCCAFDNATTRLRCEFASKLLRMQTLEAISCQLAAAARDLSTQRERRRAVMILKQARALLSALQCTPWAWGCMQPYSSELQTAVRRSGIFEHAARLVVRLLETVATGALDAEGTDSSSPDSDIATQAVSTFLAMHEVSTSHHHDVYLQQGGAGPCADHVAMALGLALLCALDGGPAYGLPEELLVAATPAALATALRASVPGDYPVTSYSSSWFDTTLHQLQLAAVVRAGSGIPGWRAALDVLLRLARLGLAAVQQQQQDGATAGEPGGSGLAGGQQQPQQQRGSAGVSRVASKPDGPSGPQLSAKRGYDIAVQSLEHLKRLLLRPRSALGRAQAVECWRLAVALTTEEMLRSGTSTFACVLAAYFDPIADLHSPAETPPDVAAPLAAGLLPCLERLFRRAGEELTARRWQSVPADPPWADHAELLKDLFHRMGPAPCGWRYLAPLLAHGEPRQAAALVVTVGKVLRHVAAGLEGCEAMGALEACFVLLAADVLLGGKEAGLASAAAPDAAAPDAAAGATAGEDGGGGGCSPAATQLRGMLWLAAREWLPSLVAVLCSRRLRLSEDAQLEHKLVLPLAVAGWLTLAASACCCLAWG